jgi:endonuclease-3
MTQRQKAQQVYEAIGILFPGARCELNYSSPLELLVAIILSAQTTDKSVNALTPTLFAKYKSLESYASASQIDMENDLRHLGLYKNKAENIRMMAKKVLDDFRGEIPNEQTALESLPGVGRKTANVFLSEYYRIPRIAVDTHVYRVATRLGFSSEADTPEKVEIKLMRLYPRSQWIDLHHRLIFFGRYFCKAKKPACAECPIISICLKPQI